MKKRLLVLGIFSAIGLGIVNIFAQESGENEFKPSFHAGILLHTYAGAQQKGFGAGSINSESDEWSPEASLYRGRIMTEAHLTPHDYVFLETELTAVVGANGMETKALIKILDAQYDHKFTDRLTVSAGKMLVSHNRNGLQTASTLMVNDFTYFQYPYNMSEESPLQNDLGRDIGINLSGGFLQNKLKYRLGAFAGKRAYFKDNALRIIGRAEYNFLDIDKYAGTNLGEGKTVTLAGGFDTQGDYMAGGADLFVDYPLGNGSVTFNGAYSYLTGGNNPAAEHSFALEIPAQNVFLAELGYYIKPLKLQPWLRFEQQAVNSEDGQRGVADAKEFDRLHSTNVLGGGLTYFFNGYGTNVKLSYVTMQKGVTDGAEIKNRTFGQIWLQLQLCLF